MLPHLSAFSRRLVLAETTRSKSRLSAGDSPFPLPPAFLMNVDRKGTILHMNQIAKGPLPEIRTATTCYQLLHAESNARLKQVLAGVFRGGEPAEIEHARRVIAAFEEAERAGRGSTSLDGKVIDVPVVKRAKALVEIAEGMPR